MYGVRSLRKRAAESDAKLKRLYDAIENGVADLADPMLKDRIAELKAIRDSRPTCLACHCCSRATISPSPTSIARDQPT